MGAAEPHDLARNGASAPGLDHDPGADRHGMEGARDLDHEAAHADDPAIDLDPVELADLFGQRFHDSSRIVVRPTQS